MSGDSEELAINEKESENAASENNVDETGKKLKRNYCYICQVQCSAAKNFLAHKSGRKHQKNLSLLQAKKKHERLKNPQKNTHESLKTVKSDKRSLNKPDKRSLNEPEIQSSQDSFINTEAKKTMNTFNRQTKGNKRYQYPNYDNNYLKYQNSKHYYSSNYKNNDSYYNSRSYYSQWNPMHSMNAPPIPNSGYNFEFANQHYTDYGYNASYSNDCFSGNKYAVFNSGDSFKNNYLPISPENPYPYYSPFNIQTSEAMESESNPSSLEHSENKKVYSEEIKKSTEAIAPKETAEMCIGNLNPVSASAVDIDKNDTNVAHATSPQFSKSNTVGDNRRLRSRSLSSSENFNNEKQAKDKIENQSLDSDSASEEKRIKEWTDSLLDTSHNKISRLLHPSNYKEKAAVNHLITKFSKSKRTENLTRNIRSNSLGSTDMNDDEIEDLNKIVESLNSEPDEISLILDSNENRCSLESSDNYSITEKEKTKENSESINNSDQGSDNQKFSDVSKAKSSMPAPVDQNSRKLSKSDEKNKGNLRTYSRKSIENRRRKSSCVGSESTKKRKDSNDNMCDLVKKQFYSPPECCEQPAASKTIELKDLNKSTQVVENPCTADSVKETNPTMSDTLPSVKEEIHDGPDENPSDSSTTANFENTLNQTCEINSDISVETLIQLFASGSVKVKEEYNDPIMDAIKEISSDELINAYSNQPFINEEREATNTPMESNSSDKSAHIAPDDSVSPDTLQSFVNSVNASPSSVANNNSSLERSDEPSLSSLNDVNKNSNNSNQYLNSLHKTHSEIPSHVNRLIKQLQEISSQEDAVKTNLVEAKSKISEINFLLEEWKMKKKKLQDEEENLRKQRNDIIKTLQGVIKTDDDNNEPKTSLPVEKTSQSLPCNKQKSNDDNENIYEKSCNSSTPSFEKKQKQKKSKILTSPESEDITILPAPVKPKPPEIIIVDDAEENMSVSPSTSKNVGNKIVTNVLSSKESSIFYEKDITAHTTIINCLVVFEDFLYTCSNDNTGKRFNLKNLSLTVTYHHSAKNVTEIVVEKVQNEALVLTSCSARVISLFIASSGTKIKTFFPPCAVMSICKGWGKFYSGLANGSVNVYNWKYEEREVVKTESPASCIDTAHQGRLHVLVILSSDGNIAIRDAETGLLIRYIKIFVKHPSWMTVYNDLAYISSSDKSLIILDIMSGRVEKRLYLSSHTTGLAVYEDYIFTITYSGIINSFNKDKCSDKMLYYGAGRNSLTCVHVYQDWVFTGNRKGNVSLFQFDPYSTVTCEFGKCDITYGLKEDLEYHVEKDHLLKKKNLSKCHWRGCNFLFPRNYDVNEKMDHLKKHIYPIHL